MEQRELGASPVGVVGLGCNNFGRRLDAERTAAVVDAALDVGVTLFDTADVYGDGLSEEYLGRALRGRRDEVVIATKVGHTMGDLGGAGASARWIRQAAADSLRRLQTDRIDLYQLHVPDDTHAARTRVIRRPAGAGNFAHLAVCGQKRRIIASGRSTARC